MLELWKASVEYRLWGWNAPSAIVLISIAYLYLELWALWKQNRRIWDERSGETVSIIWFSYYGVHAFAGVVYGLEIKSVTVATTSLLLGLIHVPIVAGLWKFKQARGSLTAAQKLHVFVFPLMIPATILLPYIHIVYACFTLGIIYGLLLQPLEMWRAKSRGVLELRLVCTYLGASVVWTCIGFYFHIPLFMVFSPFSAACLLVMLILWFRYKNNEEECEPSVSLTRPSF